MAKYLLLVNCYLLLYLYPIAYTLYPVHAQLEGSEVTYTYQIADKDAKDGDILSSSSQGLVRTTRSYDNFIFGVLQENPVIAFRSEQNQGQPVARTGIAQVTVTTVSGPINVGDYITSSEIPGYGQKALSSGYVLGIAMSNFSEGGQTIEFQGKTISVGKTAVALKIEYADITNTRSFGRLFDYLNIAFFQNIENTEQSLQLVRYIGAALVVLIAFIIGFFTFARSIPKSIEAIGRNPLAKKAIYLSLAMNIAFTIITMALGVATAIIILRF